MSTRTTLPVAPSPAELPHDQADPRMRVINGRMIYRLVGRDGWSVWREVAYKPRAAVHKTFHPGGVTEFDIDNRPVVLAEWGGSQAAVIEALLEHARVQELDFRPPSPLHDQLERARAAGFGELAEAFEMAAKVKPREPISLGTLPLGQVLLKLTPAILRVGLPQEHYLALVRRHACHDWGAHGTAAAVGELTPDQRWAPPVFGPAVENQAAVLAGRGLVRSVYPETWEKTRGPEELRITTLVGITTVIYM